MKSTKILLVQRAFYFIFIILSISSNISAKMEAVMLLKVLEKVDKAIIQRRDGDQYIIQYGVGVLSIWRYEGKPVYINSPGIFLGTGSKILLLDAEQEARIWDSEYLGTAKTNRGAGHLKELPTYENETTLFDSDGKAIAYIDFEEDRTIYLWNGYPVAYLNPDGKSFTIYGFNGKHLGWFEDGIIRDHKGFVVGFIEKAITNVITKSESHKSLQKLIPLKSLEDLEPLKPLYKAQFSEIPLILFLAKGSKEDMEDLFSD